MPHESEQTLAGINAKLDVITRLLAMAAVDDDASIEVKAFVLERAGLQPKEIAGILGTTGNTVNTKLSQSRNKSAKPKKVSRKKG